MRRPIYYEEPAISRFLFASPYMVPVWTVLRLWLGWNWLVSGLGKVRDSAWVGADAGTAITGFLGGALGRATGDSPAVAGWYAWLIEHVFLPNAVAMSYMVAFGELLIGIALILGLLTGFSAFMGGFMNASFLLAGTLSSANPVMFIVATWLVLSWRVAGFWGLDYWVLPWLGAPRDTNHPGGPPPTQPA